jgi:HSP20 family protein
MNNENAMLVRDAENRDALRSFDRLFESVFGDAPVFRLHRQAGFGWAPSIDIRETENELVVYAAVPGLNKEDVALEVKDNVLTLGGKMKPLGSDEDSWVRRELPRGEFFRAFHLPADVQVGKVSAQMKNGILEIRLPKAEEAKPRRITIG